MHEGEDYHFTPLRRLLFPIYRKELKKFLPMALLFFCILFNYALLRDVKDAITVKGAGPEIIHFIKVWIVIPVSVTFAVIYSKLSTILSRNQLFYCSLSPFILVFSLFGFVLYPYKGAILPDMQHMNPMMELYPSMKWFIMLYAKWIYVLYYAFSELWSGVVVALLFWQLANHITPLREAKRFYIMFGIIGNGGLMLAGYSLKWLTGYAQTHTPHGEDVFASSIKYTTSIFLLGCFFICLLYAYIAKNTSIVEKSEVKKYTAPPSKKPNLLECFKIIFSSRYLLLICIIVLSYSVSLNLNEVIWKKQMDKLFVDMNAYAQFMGNFTIYTALSTMVFMVIGTSIVRIGWLTAAMVTPVIILITSILFFGCLISKNNSLYYFLPFAGSPLYVIVMVGMVQNILSESAKSALFDPTKEMTYIPLDETLKVKGKAAIDVTGGKIGKALGSVIQQILLVCVAGNTLEGQDLIAPYLCGFVLVICVAWIYALIHLNMLFVKHERII